MMDRPTKWSRVLDFVIPAKNDSYMASQIPFLGGLATLGGMYDYKVERGTGIRAGRTRVGVG